jgi:transposase, IS5 family
MSPTVRQAYRCQRAVIRHKRQRLGTSPTAAVGHRGVVDESERAKNRAKSKVRAKIELDRVAQGPAPIGNAA